MLIIRWLIRGLWLISAPILTVAWLIGWAVKDRAPFAEWLFIIPPLLVVAVNMCWIFLFRKKGPMAIRFFVRWATFLIAAKIVAVDFCWNFSAAPTGETLRIVHWNTARNRIWPEALLQALQKDKPDICLISEAPRTTNWIRQIESTLKLPYVFDDSGMTLASRYPFTPMGTIKITNGRGWSARIDTPSGPLDIMTVDIISRPNLDRHAPMNALAHWLDERDTWVPLVLLGDFNTMRDSLAFQPLRARLRHAYEAGGWGWPYTWPMPIPLYAIDHVWISPTVRVQNYRLRYSMLSDHLRQVFDMEITR